MADELEKEVLKSQRDIALDVADTAVAQNAQHQVERDAALNVAAGTAIDRDVALAQRNRLAAESAVLAGQRDAAQQYAAESVGECHCGCSRTNY